MWLWSNEIHEEGASHIAELLNSTSIVSKLSLDGNPIGDKGLQTIFDALKQNKTLKFLSVSACGMTDTGVASLADALHTNNTLETLYIDGNEAITENGLICLVEAVSRNSGMKKLCIPEYVGLDRVRKTVNEARGRIGLPDIDVWRHTR
jgi:Ran GTPase-activating protein (RanGAP) involved in mRNA processing and transport